MKSLPSTDQILALHKKYAPNDDSFELIYTHCQAVRDIALKLLKERPNPLIDQGLVIVGCLLHDIGSYQFYRDGSFTDEYIRHGVAGAELLAHEGFDEWLCRFASHHTGSGLTKQEIISQGLPLPHIDLIPESPEERLVAYADKFHSKTPKFNKFETYRIFTAQFGADNVARFEDLAHEFGKPELMELANQYHHPLT